MPKVKNPILKESPQVRDARASRTTVQAAGDPPPTWGRTARETVESIVIAFILAFLFRSFEAEAFVIPTGSMAPTLQGRHKDITCPQCGYDYRVNASVEDGDQVQQIRRHLNDPGLQPRERARLEQELANSTVTHATCPMCRYTLRFNGPDPLERQQLQQQYPSYNGDRILVSKFAYELADPQRWDVIVFKYPEDAKTNYIKRLVGLPGETVRIARGDVFVRKPDEAEFTIARKDNINKLRAMLQDVYDNDYVYEPFLAKGWPVRWQNETPQPDRAAAWQAEDGTRAFAIDGRAAGEVWLRYQHLVPDDRDWDLFQAGNPAFDEVHPELITDFYAYNSGSRVREFDPNWVGDLVLDATVEVLAPQGELVLELVRGGWRFQCRIDLATGIARLAILGLPEFAPTASTSVRGLGTYELSFVNVDQQLRLTVGGNEVTFDQPTTYPRLEGYDQPELGPPQGDRGSDFSPVGIASLGAAVRVRHLRILRDVYYTGLRLGPDGKQEANVPQMDFVLREAHTDENGDFVDDQYFALGDNSPQSKDSRLWQPNSQFVDRRFLIGKAIFIYWPHSFDRIPGTEIPFPYFPNFADMGFVR